MGDLSSVGDVLELAIPVILALDHAPSVEFPALELHRHDVAGGLVKQLHRYPQAPAHGYSSLLAEKMLR